MGDNCVGTCSVIRKDRCTCLATRKDECACGWWAQMNEANDDEWEQIIETRTVAVIIKWLRRHAERVRETYNVEDMFDTSEVADEMLAAAKAIDDGAWRPR